MGQNPGSGSKFNVFGSTKLLISLVTYKLYATTASVADQHLHFREDANSEPEFNHVFCQLVRYCKITNTVGIESGSVCVYFIVAPLPLKRTENIYYYYSALLPNGLYIAE